MLHCTFWLRSFLESIKHDFVKAPLIWKATKQWFSSVEHFSDDQEVLGSIPTGAILLFCSSPSMLAGFCRNRRIIHKLEQRVVSSFTALCYFSSMALVSSFRTRCLFLVSIPIFRTFFYVRFFFNPGWQKTALLSTFRADTFKASSRDHISILVLVRYK